MALHPVPNKTASWWYVFGSAAFVLLMLQIVTRNPACLGVCTLCRTGMEQLERSESPIDSWLVPCRAMHGWGSNFMVAVVLIHMAQVFSSVHTNSRES